MASLSFYVLLVFLSSTQANAQKNTFTHEVIENVLHIGTDNFSVTLTAYDDEAIEVAYQSNTLEQLPSFAIAETTKKHAAQALDKGNVLDFSAGALRAVVTKSPFNISFYRNNKLLLAEESGFFVNTNATNAQTSNTNSDDRLGFRFNLSNNEKLLGGGERVLGMDRRGHKMPLYNKAHYGYTTQSNQMYFGLPAVMSSNKYILLFDNSAKGSMDLGKTENSIMQFNAVGGRSAYLVFSGKSYPNLIENYVEVTGKQPLPPRWALGSFASRFGYRSEQEVRNTVDKFLSEDFPLDALVLDLYWFGKDIKGHMGNLAWDKTTFPTPEKMIKDLAEKGVKTIVITEPFVLKTSKKWNSAVESKALAVDKNGEPKRFDFYFGNTGLIDVFNQQGRGWLNQTYQTLHQQGVEGWWGDLGEPEVHPADTIHTLDNGLTATADEIHNVYGHRWAEMVYNQQLAMHPTKRPFIMMRAGFAGSQRYGMLPWTGDVSRSWGGLQSQVELSLQMSVLGMAYTHSDLGGFAGGETFDAELYTRWLQYGVFQPVYRPHAQDNIAPEPVFHGEKTKNILRDYVKLRYQLLPYNYTLAYQNTTTGMPLMRPLFFEDENDLSLIDNTNSYLWGDAFLVTPVVNAGVSSVKVPLPKGVWFDYWSNKKYLGNQEITMPTSLETLPLLVRAGAFIPMIDSIQSTKTYTSKDLSVHYYADVSVNKSQGEMYEDDGETRQSIENRKFQRLHFSAKHSGVQNSAIDFQFSTSGNGYESMPKARSTILVIHNLLEQPKMIELTSGEQVITIAVNTLKDNQPVKSNAHLKQAYWDATTKILRVPFVWRHEEIKIAIQ